MVQRVREREDVETVGTKLDVYPSVSVPGQHVYWRVGGTG